MPTAPQHSVMIGVSSNGRAVTQQELAERAALIDAMERSVRTYGVRDTLAALSAAVGCASAEFDPHTDATPDEQRGERFRKLVSAEQVLRQAVKELPPD